MWMISTIQHKHHYTGRKVHRVGQSNGIQNNEKSRNPEVVWFVEGDILDPGEHVLTYDVNWSKMIDDGMATSSLGGKNATLHDE